MSGASRCKHGAKQDIQGLHRFVSRSSVQSTRASLKCTKHVKDMQAVQFRTKTCPKGRVTWNKLELPHLMWWIARRIWLQTSMGALSGLETELSGHVSKYKPKACSAVCLSPARTISMHSCKALMVSVTVVPDI
jgi:hypothetical protein